MLVCAELQQPRSSSTWRDSDRSLRRKVAPLSAETAGSAAAPRVRWLAPNTRPIAARCCAACGGVGGAAPVAPWCESAAQCFDRAAAASGRLATRSSQPARAAAGAPGMDDKRRGRCEVRSFAACCHVAVTCLLPSFASALRVAPRPLRDPRATAAVSGDHWLAVAAENGGSMSSTPVRRRRECLLPGPPRREVA